MLQCMIFRWGIVVALFVAAIGIYFFPIPKQSHPSPLAEIAISDATALIGNVAEQSGLEHLVTIRNSSATESVDLTLTASCHCTSISPDKLHLAAQESQQVRLVIDLRSAPVRYSSEFEWPFALKLIAKCEDNQGNRRSRSWELTATVQRSLLAEPPVVRLSEAHDVIQGETAFFRVRLRSNVTLAQIEACVSSQADNVTVSQDAEGHVLEYVYANTAQVGEFTSSIHVFAITETGETLPEIVIPVTGQVVPSFRATSNEITFARQPIETLTEKVISVMSIKGVPFRVELLEPIAEELVIELVERSNLESPQQIKVSLRLDREGNHLWEIPVRIHPTAPPTASVDLKLGVRAFGVASVRSVATAEGER